MMKKIFTGVTFTALWGSGAVVTKLGLSVVQPLVLINTRFFVAAILMLGFSFFINKDRLPKRNEWLPLVVCGVLCIAIYPSAFVYAMKNVTAGIGTLGIATCPLIISTLNALWLRQKITWNIWAGLFLGIIGVAVATYPLLIEAHATPLGVFLLTFSMICYSVGTVYYQSINWNLSLLSINGWQVLFGCMALLPFTFGLFVSNENIFDTKFCFSVFWLVLPISIIGVQIWLHLLKAEPTKAALWLFLCPIFGFFYAYCFTGEPITVFTICGTILVIGGLYLGKKEIPA